MFQLLGKRQQAVHVEGPRPPKSIQNPQLTPNQQQTKPPKIFQTPTPTQSTTAHILNVAQDGRPYLNVRMFNKKVTGLLDSGASITVKRWCPLIKDHEKELRKTNISLKVANNEYLEVVGCMNIPYEYRGHSATVKTVIVTELAQDLLLGFDFWIAIGLKIVDEDKFDVLNVAAASISTEVQLKECDKMALNKEVDKFLKSTNTFLGQTDLLEHEIYLVDGAQPFVRRTHYYSPAMQEKINKELDYMLEMGIVDYSASPVASPVVPVKKSDGSVRLCLDSRKLNLITRRDQFPLPNPNHIFARMQHSKYLSVIDLSKAFWQIPLSNTKIEGQFATAQELTAFVIPGRGLFQFKVMPFGLSNAPATQCRLMAKVIGHDLEDRCFVYMDDILLVSKTVTDMIELIGTVATRLRKAKLSINFEKSRFFAKEVKYLGYIINEKGLAADPARLEVMNNYPIPRNPKAVRRFLGLTGYYRRLIRDYSGIAAPLTDLLKGNGKRFTWSKPEQEAFQRLKDAMCSAPIIRNPDFTLPFYIQCDASDVSGAAALGQIQDNNEVIISYYSHKWTTIEAKYGATEREAACVLFSVRHFRDYVWGREITIITDAQAVTHIRTLKTEGSSRLARWALELNNYELTIKHRAGKASAVPDALSRAVESILAVDEEINDSWYQQMCQRVREKPESYPDFKMIGTRLLKFETEKDDIGCYNYKWKEYLPETHRKDVINEIHRQLCHVGWVKCLSFIRRQYFWPKMISTVEKEVRRCDTCKATKSTVRNVRVPMGNPRSANLPFQMVAIDHWGGTTKSRKGNTHLLIVVDVFSKYVLLHPVKDTSAEFVVRFLEEQVILKFGVPQILISDNHRPLIGRRMVELLNQYDIEHWTIAAYHAQSNPAERYLKTVSAAIRAQVMENNADQRLWDSNISQIQWAINTTINESTKMSPFFVNFGREALISGSEYEMVANEVPRSQMSVNELNRRFETLRIKIKQRIQAAQAKYRNQYDRNTRITEFQINERVWRKNRELSNAAEQFSQKLAPRYLACKIIESLGRDTYRVRDEARDVVNRVHANDLLKDFQ